MSENSIAPDTQGLAPAVSRENGPHRNSPATGRREFFRYAGLLPVVSVVVPLSILGLVGWLSWRTVWQDAETEMRRAAASAGEYGKRALESYTLAAGRINDRLHGLSDRDILRDELLLHQELRRMDSELSQSELAYVIDRDGYVLLTSTEYPAPRTASLADRDYFQALSSHAQTETFVSQTFVGRFDGRLLFTVARRRSNSGNPPAPDGFDGVVTVSVSPLVLADGLRRLLPEPTDRMAFVRADGYGISTTSGLLGRTEPLPKVEPHSPFHAFAADGAQSAVYLSTTAMPGTSALLAMDMIEGFPIYAVSIRPREQIVGRWWDIMAAHLWFGIPATSGLLLLSLRVWRDQRRLAASNADLRRDNDLSTDRLVRAKRFGLVGTFEFDLRTGESRRSPEYMSVHGLPAVATVETHDDWANRLHPDDRQRAESHLWEALSEESGASEYGQTYRIITSTGEVRWIAARGEITRDATGRAVMLLGAHVDVTPLRTTELALAESDARLRLAQEAVGIGAWEWVRSARALTCSRRMTALLGFDPAKGGPGVGAVLARVHPDDRRSLGRAMRQARRSGAFSSEFRILRPCAQGGSETIWVAARAKLVTSGTSANPRLVGIAYDITERKRAEELTTLMAHEVEHRAKNALAVVSGLLRMTRADSAEELAQVMEGRVQALSQTMALLGRGGWKGADLREIVESELKPFARSGTGDGLVIEISGPPVLIGVEAAQPLSMALHELTTNAAKYGSLSAPGGRVAVHWLVEDERVHLRWQETGGPSLEGPPPRKGFGSRLITMLFEDQIQGRVTKRWEASGLVCEMSFPP